MHVNKRTIPSAEWKFSSQCKLGSNPLGKLVVYWSDNQDSLNGVLLLILVFEHTESTQSAEIKKKRKVFGFSVMRNRMFRIYVYLHFVMISTESTHVFFMSLCILKNIILGLLTLIIMSNLTFTQMS